MRKREHRNKALKQGNVTQARSFKEALGNKSYTSVITEVRIET